MGVGDEDALHEILLLRPHPDLAASAPALALVKADGVPLDVAGVGDGDDHVLFDDQVLDVDVLGTEDDLGAPLVAVTRPDLGELLNDHVENLLRVVEDPLELMDQRGDLGVFRVDLVPFEAGQALEAHFEDRLRLEIAQAEPAAEGGGRLRGAPGGLDHGDHLVDPVEGNDQPLQDVGPLPRPREFEGRPADDHLLAELQEALENVPQVEDPGLPPVDREHDDPEGGLHLGVLVELVQDDGGGLVPLQVEDDADPLAVRLVPEVGDPADLLLLDKLGDLLDQVRLVHLVGELGDDDALPVVACIFLDQRARPHPDDPAASPVGGEDPLAAVDEAGRREVRPLDVVHEPVDGDFGVADHGDRPVDHLPEIVGRNVRRHADGDAGGAVQEQQRDPRRQDGRFLQGFVVVRREIDGVLLQVG